MTELEEQIKVIKNALKNLVDKYIFDKLSQAEIILLGLDLWLFCILPFIISGIIDW